jgi:hypothetical protein
VWQLAFLELTAGTNLFLLLAASFYAGGSASGRRDVKMLHYFVLNNSRL